MGKLRTDSVESAEVTVWSKYLLGFNYYFIKLS